MTEQFSGDLFTIPVVTNPGTLAEGALVIGAAAAGTWVLVKRRVDRLDLVRALKTRE
jgi:putative ABC transport system permease protein